MAVPLAQRASTDLQVDVEDRRVSLVANPIGTEDHLGENRAAARFDRELAREQMRVYTAWCFGALFVLGAIAQCITWITHAVR